MPTLVHKKREPQPKSKSKIPSVRVDSFAIQRLTLGEAIAGEDITVSIRAKLNSSVPEKSIDAEWKILRVDGLRGFCNGYGEFLTDPAQLTVDIKLSDPEGIVAGRIFDREKPLPVLIDVEGQGQLSDWNVAVQAAVKPFGVLAAGLTLKIDEYPIIHEEMTLEATGELALRLPSREYDEDAIRLQPFSIWFQEMSRQLPALKTHFSGDSSLSP